MKSIIIILKDEVDHKISYKNIISSTVINDNGMINIAIRINDNTHAFYNIPIDQVIYIKEYSDTNL
jgi:hypothetical protein